MGELSSKASGMFSWHRGRLLAAAAVGLLGAGSAAAALSGQSDPSLLTVALWLCVAVGSFALGIVELIQARLEYAQSTSRVKDETQRLHQLRLAELRAHFEPRARGVLPFGPLSGWYFCGRVRALSEIVIWLTDAHGDGRARVVTGGPGSGKSALLGRLVVMSTLELRGRVPRTEIERTSAETLCPVGAISVCVHARRRTVDEVAAAISHEMGIDAMNTNSLLVALSDRESSPLLGVVIDAIDEAVTPDRLVRDLLVPLARMAEQASVRLLIGTRPGLDRRFVRAFDRDAVEIDLDDACYLDPDDIVAYAERLLLTTDEDGNLNSSVRLRTPYRQRPELVVTVARAIADQAGRSFLVTYLSSLALLQAPRIVDTTQPGWETELPHNAGEAVDYYLDRFGTDRARVRDLLTPLAFAEGDGIGNPEVWAKVATVLGTATYVATDVAWLLSETTASDLLSRVENEDDVTDPVTYRLFHEALAEYFRDNLTSRMSRQAVSRAFAEVLVKIVPTRLGQSGRQWSKADYYTRTYLAVHAAAGGMFDDLVCDFSFLAVAEPSRLLQALPSVHTAQGRRMTEALTRIGRQLLSFPESERIPYLQLATRKSGYAELADQADSLSSGRPWSVPWARWTTPAAGRTIGHHSLYIQDLSLMPLQGRVIVATAEQGAVRLWDLKSGRSAGEFVATEFTDIVSMTIIATDQGPQVVTGHIDDTIVFWNPIDESRIVRKTRSTRGRELVSLAHDLLLSDGPDGSLMLWKASNTSLMASIAVPGGLCCGQLAVWVARTSPCYIITNKEVSTFGI